MSSLYVIPLAAILGFSVAGFSNTDFSNSQTAYIQTKKQEHQHYDVSEHYRKPGQLQVITYNLSKDISPSELVDLNLSILPHLPYKTDAMELTVTAENGIEITQEPRVINAKTWRFQFRALQNGRYYLNVYVREANLDNQPRFIPKVQQIFSIPIQVGDEV